MTLRSLTEILGDLPAAAVQSGAPIPPELAVALQDLRISATEGGARQARVGSGRFVAGLFFGSVLGAGLGVLLAPKTGSELRQALGEQARHWGNTASEQHRNARETASTWAEKGREMANQAREAAREAAERARAYGGAVTGAGSSSSVVGDSTENRSIDPDTPGGRGPK